MADPKKPRWTEGEWIIRHLEDVAGEAHMLTNVHGDRHERMRDATREAIRNARAALAAYREANGDALCPAPSPIVTTPKDVWDSLRGGTATPLPQLPHSTCVATPPNAPDKAWDAASEEAWRSIADAEKDARIAALERKLAELTGAAEPCSKSPPGASALCKLRTVLAAQSGEKEEAKP